MESEVAAQAKFIVYANVGKLAKSLRMMGYDALLYKGHDDSGLVEAARIERRIILTRDTEVAKRRDVARGHVPLILLKQDDPEEQLREVVGRLGLRWRLEPFSICLEDNQKLAPVPKSELRRVVPAYVFRNQDQFMRCPVCGRIYWRGTHWKAMEELLRRLEQKGPAK